jgi:hypothetical protein
MIPLAQVWYTKPPKSDKYFGTVADWNQGIMQIILSYIKDGKERNFYSEGLYDYLMLERDYEPHMILICHPVRKELINRLEYVSLSHIWTEYGQVTINFNDKYDRNKLMYLDGIYENEITLIDEHYR